MKKRGFTLVELLAVIVIMAVILIIAIPNVIEGLDKAKSKSFVNDARSLYQTAKSQYKLDKADSSISYSRDITYCTSKELKHFFPGDSVETNCNKSLELKTDGNSLEYIILVDKSGEVVKMYVSNYVYDFTCNDADECKDVTAHLIEEE